MAEERASKLKAPAAACERADSRAPASRLEDLARRRERSRLWCLCDGGGSCLVGRSTPGRRHHQSRFRSRASKHARGWRRFACSRIQWQSSCRECDSNAPCLALCCLPKQKISLNDCCRCVPVRQRQPLSEANLRGLPVGTTGHDEIVRSSRSTLIRAVGQFPTVFCQGRAAHPQAHRRQSWPSADLLRCLESIFHIQGILAFDYFFD